MLNFPCNVGSPILISALQRARAEELKRQADELAEERRKAREQALEWTRDIKLESDEERERKAAKKANRRVKTEGGSGDEGLAAEPRKKRRTGKLKRPVGEEGEDGALFSGDEDGEKPAKKVCLEGVEKCDDQLMVFLSGRRRSALCATMKMMTSLRAHRGRNRCAYPVSNYPLLDKGY